jgi:hypothetical protein
MKLRGERGCRRNDAAWAQEPVPRAHGGRGNESTNHESAFKPDMSGPQDYTQNARLRTYGEGFVARQRDADCPRPSQWRNSSASPDQASGTLVLFPRMLPRAQ